MIDKLSVNQTRIEIQQNITPTPAQITVQKATH